MRARGPAAAEGADVRRAAAAPGGAPRARAPAGAPPRSCPQTTLADIEDEVMCPRLRHPARHRRPTRRRPSSERALHRAASSTSASRRTRSRTALVAQFGDDVLAVPDDGRASTSRPTSCRSLGVARRRWRSRPRRASRWRRAAAARPPARREPAPRRRRLRPARRGPGALRPVIGRRRRRHHGLRRVRRRLPLVRLAVRAAARARLPVERSPACRSPTSRRARSARRSSSRR